MKVCCIVYHKNLEQYPKEWIETFKQSILNQTFKEFDIWEFRYGGSGKIFGTDYSLHGELNNHAEAMNALLSLTDSYDYVFNTNIDDFYSLDRIEKQLVFAKQGYDIVSSNFTLINEHGIPYHEHRFHTKNIKYELENNHNIICHPVVMYSKNFIENNKYEPDEIPFEDMKLWQRGIKAGFKFIILPDVLCYHRVHKTSVGNTK